MKLFIFLEFLSAKRYNFGRSLRGKSMTKIISLLSVLFLIVSCGPRDPFLTGKFVEREVVTKGKSKGCNGATWGDIIVSEADFKRLESEDFLNSDRDFITVTASKFSCNVVGEEANLKIANPSNPVLGKLKLKEVIIDKASALDDLLKKSLGKGWQELKSEMARVPKGDDPILTIHYIKVLEINGDAGQEIPIREIEEELSESGQMFSTCDPEKAPLSSVWVKPESLDSFIDKKIIFLPLKKCFAIDTIIDLVVKDESETNNVGTIHIDKLIHLSQSVFISKLQEQGLTLLEAESLLKRTYGKLFDSYTIILFSDYKEN